MNRAPFPVTFAAGTAVSGVFALIALAVSMAALASSTERVEGAVHEAGFVGYVQAHEVAPGTLEGWQGVTARRLSGDPSSGRLAIHATFPPGHTVLPPTTPLSLDVVMLEGALTLGGEVLERWDFAFLPPGGEPQPFTSDLGAQALLFFDPPSDDAEAVDRQRARGLQIKRYAADGWEPAALAKAAGATAKLEIFHLKRDPDTTARTWYVRLIGDMSVPWEVHSMPEEGFVMSGAYELAECLPKRTVIGHYDSGGYFWRPPGQPHSGPESGPVGDVVWLQRSPVALDVTFYESCRDGSASMPIRRPADN